MKQAKYRRIRKAWHGGLRSLPKLDGKRHREQDKIEFIDVGHNTQFDVTPDNENALAKVLADDGLARRIRKLQADQFPYGTAPEMVMYEYLTRHHIKFVYQAQVLGGYRGGGLVPDFVIMESGSAVVLLIQGIYWHNIPGKREKDISDKLRLLATTYEGMTISDVVFVWENKLMQPNPQRDRIMADAIVGIETGP